MEFQRFFLLFVLSLLCSQARVQSSGSVFFIDSVSHQFFRESSPDHVPVSISDTETAAAVSVLLGFAPPSTLSAASSSKLNQVLVPNPFQRPRAVFMLEVSGVDGSNVLTKDDGIFSRALTSGIVFGSKEAEIQLPGDINEVSVTPLDEKPDVNDKEIANFASWIGGTYASETEEPLNGELTIPLANGSATAKFHMSKIADRDFTLKILYLMQNFRRGIEMHRDLSDAVQSPAELLTGTFDGIKVLQKQYGPEGVTQQGKEVLLAILSKMYSELQDAYQGQIVGVVIFKGSKESPIFSLVFSPQRSARWLEETEAPIDTAARQALVRRTLAWITGIILLISTLLGIHFLLNMTLTRDTLLYSNVKLD